MKFEIAKLPYAPDALEPYMSRDTLHFHHDKHHQGYLDKVKAGLDESLHDRPLTEIIRETEDSTPKIFNSAAQVWNHDFFWYCLTPDKPVLNDGALHELIDKSFGSLEKFNEQFASEAADQFGSGWAWLVYVPGNSTLDIISTANAKTPVTSADSVPLLTLDVWEHAYYLDYKHDRPGYIQAFLEHLINWDFAAENLKRAMAR
jgi:superoxide dismutase, Fe-Mn family